MADDLTARRIAHTRQLILTSATEMFVTRGFNETTMEEVANAVGVSRRTLYRYFPTKEDIVFERFFARTLQIRPRPWTS